MLHIKKIKPLFNGIITSGDLFEEDITDRGLIISKKGDLKPYQRVLAVGSVVKDIAVGDMVMINVDNFAVKKYDANSLQNDLDNNKTITYRLNWVAMDDEDGNPQECLFMSDRDILYVFEGEEIPENPSNLILPKKKTIITN